MEYFEIKNGDDINFTVYPKNGDGMVNIEIEIGDNDEPNDYIIDLYPTQVENLIKFLEKQIK